MQLTNKLNLPDVFVNAIKRNIYEPKEGNYSVTSIQQSPRQFHLYRRHWNELTEDVSERIWALMGSAVHYVLSEGQSINSMNEERLYAEINGKRFIGIADTFDGETISDYKFTSVYSIIFDTNEHEETMQLNCYKYLYELAGFKPKKLQNIKILRDWTKSKTFEEGYPKENIKIVERKIIDNDIIKEYIENKINFLEATKELKDDELPLCTASERWERPTVYAIMKNDNKRSIKNCETLEQAEAKITELENGKDKYRVEVRKGESVKCENYCPVKVFCSQYKNVVFS